jgi:hypothetical protein
MMLAFLSHSSALAALAGEKGSEEFASIRVAVQVT